MVTEQFRILPNPLLSILYNTVPPSSGMAALVVKEPPLPLVPSLSLLTLLSNCSQLKVSVGWVRMWATVLFISCGALQEVNLV